MSLEPWPTNGHMIADVARLGYLGGRVLDLTHGLGVFWRQWQPDELITNDWDTDREADHHIDLMNPGAILAAFAPASFDAVVSDVPYKFSGTPTPSDQSSVDARFGVDRYRPARDVADLLRTSVLHAGLLTKPGGHVLVKCQDQVVSGSVHWQSYELVTWLNVHPEIGLDLVAEFIFPSYRRQPAGRRQLNARRNFSKLLVFRQSR